MIARMWHGKVRMEAAESYHSYLLETGLNDYKKITGNRGVFLLRRDEPGITHFYTFTFWTGLDAVIAFAGADYTKAVYYAGDKDYLLEFEPEVIHFDVLEGAENLLMNAI